MGDRRAVAATLVSVIVFTSLLFANLAVYSAGDSYAASAALSAAQEQEVEYASFLTGISAYSALVGTQAYLQAHPVDCSLASAPYLASLAGSESLAGSDNGISYSLSTSWGYTLGIGAPPAGDDTSMLASFDGYSPDGLNIEVTTSVNESESGGLPTFSSMGTETVHLPLPISSDLAFCTASLSAVRESLSLLPGCNSSSVDERLALLRNGNPDLDSVSIGASAQPSGLEGFARCNVSYWVTTTEQVEGVSGAFDWTMVGSGSLST